jgi:hypothetical protein
VGVPGRVIDVLFASTVISCSGLEVAFGIRAYPDCVIGRGNAELHEALDDPYISYSFAVLVKEQKVITIPLPRDSGEIIIAVVKAGDRGHMGKYILSGA